MDRKSFELLYRDAVEALTSRRMHDALNCTQGLLSVVRNPDLNREQESIRRDYGMMLAFMAKGGTDPQRELVHRNLTNRAFALLDKSARLCHILYEKDLYTETFNRCDPDRATSFDHWAETADLLREELSENRGASPAGEAEENSLYDVYDKLFDHIWTAPLFHASEAERLKSFMERQEADEQALLVSAVMLNIQRHFDPQKYRLLLHFCRTRHAKVRARAMTAVVWTYMQYEKRFAYYPDLSDGLSLLAQDERLKGELVLLQHQFLLSLETVKAERKLHDEIFPDLLKNRNYLRNKMGVEQMEEDLAKALRGEPNAEWEKVWGNKKLADNMKEIIAMGREGIDINLGTFSSLKGFPFFQSVAHWFTPFNKRRPEVKNIFPPGIRHNPIQILLMGTENFCESDKYSLCLMLNQIAPSQRDMMITQISAQMEDNEDVRDMAGKSEDIGSVYRNYLQDLYRFFKLHPRKSQFDDPFKRDLLFTRYAVLESVLKTPAYLRETASFLMKRERYRDAIAYMEEMLSHETADTEMLQRVAFCYQHTDRPSKAIYYYQQADLLSPDNEWILKQMCLCYSALGRYEQELDCLNSLEKINPGDAFLISEIGLCLMQLDRYEEAARRFYELAYKEERVVPSWRAIAWCNFKMGHLEQADKYYRKILQQDKVTWEDYLNAGHTAWCLKQTEEAIARYREYLRIYRGKRKDAAQPLLNPFDEDRKELLLHGLNDLEIGLMRDILQSDTES